VFFCFGVKVRGADGAELEGEERESEGVELKRSNEKCKTEHQHYKGGPERTRHQ